VRAYDGLVGESIVELTCMAAICFGESEHGKLFSAVETHVGACPLSTERTASQGHEPLHSVEAVAEPYQRHS
jgi:hypothetical protein